MMKYKIGDKVIIKTWEKLKGENGLTSCGSVTTPSSFPKGASFTTGMERDINQKAPDRILTITGINFCYYRMEKMTVWDWNDYMIEELAKDHYIILDSISDRFDLMDFE